MTLRWIRSTRVRVGRRLWHLHATQHTLRTLCGRFLVATISKQGDATRVTPTTGRQCLRCVRKLPHAVVLDFLRDP